MPVARRQRASPQSRFCRYEDPEGRRCRRIATVEDALCREHAIVLSGQLQHGGKLHEVIGAIDRELARSRDPVVGAFARFVSGLFAGSPPPFPQSQQAQQAQQRARSQQPPRPSSPPRPPPPDPTIAARVVMGFEPTEPLTRELVTKRKQQLARVFHPDVSGGSDSHMKRVNQAADVLLAKLP